jgi:hypothetical protein
VCILELDGGWDCVWQDGLELNRVDAGLEHAVDNVKDAGSVLEELFRVFQQIRMVSCDSAIALSVLSGVVTNEGTLLTALDLKLDMRSFDSLHNLHVDDTGDSVARLIEWVLRLDLDFALREVCPFVGEEKHIYSFFNNDYFEYLVV